MIAARDGLRSIYTYIHIIFFQSLSTSNFSLFLFFTMSTQNESLLNKCLQDEKLTAECRELLRSLPIEKGWLGIYHLYQGFWHVTGHMDGILSTQRHFRALDSDILLATIPKSGTTWLKAIAFALLNRTHYSEPNSKSDHPLLHNNPHDLVPFLEHDLYGKDPDPDLSSFTSPRMFATHLTLVSLPESVKDSKCKIVYLCRNPKDTFVSLWSHVNKIRLEGVGLEETFDKFCRGLSIYGPYWDHVLDYYKASSEMPHKVLFLKYEELKEKPREQFTRLAEFLGCPFSEDEEAHGGVDEILKLCGFHNLSSLEVNQSGKISIGLEKNSFFRKGEVGDWVNYLSAEMTESIDRITQEKLRGSGLKLL